MVRTRKSGEMIEVENVLVLRMSATWVLCN